MADNVIGIKFGVAGGKGFQAGSSGALIKEQLEYLASRIKLKVNINKTYFKNQLSSLKKELDKALGELNINVRANVKPNVQGGGSSGEGGDSTQQVASYESVTKALEKLYQARVKLLKMPKADDGSFATVAGVKVNSDAETLDAQYKKQFEELSRLEDVDNARVQAIKDYRYQLEQAYQIQKKSLEESTQQTQQMASPIDIAKLRERAAELYVDNGFDDVIARSKKAKELVDEFAASVKAAFDQKGGLTKEQVKELNTKFLETKATLKVIQKETDTLGNKIKEAFSSRVIQRIAQMLLLTLLRALKQVYDNVKKIDAAMTELRIITGVTPREMDAAAKSIAKSAKEIGASVVDLTKSTSIYARLGFGLKDAQILAKETTMYANISGVNVNEATTNITGILKAYNIGADGLEQVLDQMIWVGNNFAISQAEIGEAMNNAASALASNGNTLQEAIGIVTAANASLQNVSKASTAVRTIAARISASTAELEELGEDAGSILSTADLDTKMRAFGVAVSGANGELRSTYAILGDLAQKWDTFNDAERAAIADMLAGTRQQNAFYSIMQNWNDAANVVDNAAKGVGSLQDAQEKYVDSIEGRTNKLKAAWEEFSTTLLDSGIVKFFVSFLEILAKVLNAIFSLGNGFIAKAGLISAAAIGLIAVFKKIGISLKALKAAFIKFKATLNITATGIKGFFMTVGAAMKKFLADNAPILIITTIITLMTSLEGKAKGFVELGVGLVAILVTAIIIGVKSIDTVVKGFMASNPLGWILAAITAVVAIVKGVIDVIKSFNPSYEDLKEAAKECKDAWKETKEELEEVKNKIKEVQEAIDELNSKDKLSIVDQQELQRLNQELELLKQQEAVKEEAATVAQRDAMNAAEDALDKYKSKNTIKDNNGNVIKSFDSRVYDALKDYRNSSDRDWALKTIQEYNEVLDGFEYGLNEKMDSYLADRDKLLDMYTAATQSTLDAWSAIISRTTNQGAVDALKSFADTYSDTTKITGAALEELAQQTPEVQKLFEYLKTIGIWDGTNWDDLTGLIGDLRTKLVELAEINIVDDIEAITDKFDVLSDALSDVTKNGIVSLGTLQTLMDKYPSLLDKYFNRDLDGYKLSGDYQGQSNFDILKDMAITSLQEYQKVLEDAKKTLAGLTKEDDDYETALKNLATAQDNLNIKEIEWASLLRELAISEETDRLEKMQDALEEQLDI